MALRDLRPLFICKKNQKKSRREIQYAVLERDGRWGGQIATQSADGFLIEGGADLLLAQKPAGIRLCKDLGLGARLISPNRDRQRTFLVQNGKLVPFPEDFSLVPSKFWPLVTSPMFSLFGKVRMGLDLVIPQAERRAR